MNRRKFLASIPGSLGVIGGCQKIGRSGQTSPTGTKDDAETRTAAATPTPPGGIDVFWNSGPELPKRRTQTTAVALNERLYVIGGIVGDAERTTAVYEPSEAIWKTAAPPPKPVNHTSAVTFENHIHVFGGYSGSFLGSPPLDAHWVYNPKSDRWRKATPLPTPRGALVAVVADDRIITIGGATEQGTTNLVEIYDPSNDSWAEGSNMPTAREHLAATVIDDSVYVAGGRRGLSPMVDTLERYHPGEDTWKGLPAMPTARAGIAGDALAGRFFVFGGEEVGKQVFGEVEVYDPRADLWTSVTPLPTPRWGLGVASNGDSIYTVGGGAVPGGEETRTLEILSLKE